MGKFLKLRVIFSEYFWNLKDENFSYRPSDNSIEIGTIFGQKPK